MCCHEESPVRRWTSRSIKQLSAWKWEDSPWSISLNQENHHRLRPPPTAVKLGALDRLGTRYPLLWPWVSMRTSSSRNSKVTRTSLPRTWVTRQVSVSEAIARNLLTRAGVLSRVAKLYDPCGWWEPLKVQMKLTLQHFSTGLGICSFVFWVNHSFFAKKVSEWVICSKKRAIRPSLREFV